MASTYSIALSSLQAESEAINITGNNLANLNTDGFKGSNVDFKDLFSQYIGADSGYQIGLGVGLPINNQNFSQGSIQNSTSAMAVAIQGNGFFSLVAPDGQPLYTRDGNFTVSSTGVLQTQTGENVQGWNAPASGGAINTSQPPTNIVLPTGTILPPQITTTMSVSANLDANAADYNANSSSVVNITGGNETLVFTPSGGSPITVTLDNTNTGSLTAAVNAINAQTASAGIQAIPNSSGTGISFQSGSNFTVTEATTNLVGTSVFGVTGTAGTPTTQAATSQTVNVASTDATLSAPVQVVDSLGNVHDLTVNFTKAGPDTWNYAVTIPGADVGATSNQQLASGKLVFTPSGLLDTAKSSTSVAVTLNSLTDGASSPQTVTWNLLDSSGNGLITQYAETSGVSSTNHDGFQAGELNSVALQNGGQVVASFSNGQQKTVAQLAMANIENPDSMQNVGNNNFAATTITAPAAIGLPQSGGRGEILGNAVEASNVDMATQFTNLIVYQSAYQASSRVITTADQMTQDLLSLIH